jgi:cytochrome c oxidase subunit 3
MQKHPYHLVDISPWPIIGAIGTLVITSGLVMYMHSYSGGGMVLSLGLIILLTVMTLWWKDVIREGTFGGHHTKLVQRGLRIGMILFIISEVFFFLAFFWAFFHSSLSPSVELGSIWPPKGIEALSPWEVPLLNTIILLSSGATLTWSHHALICGNRKEAILGLSLTILLGIIFTSLQLMEYYEAGFTISDGVYGSTFYGATGLHGLHVIIGTTFLLVCFFRLLFYHFTRGHHFGFEASAWYWHFVDVVWIFLYLSIYSWGY